MDKPSKQSGVWNSFTKKIGSIFSKKLRPLVQIKVNNRVEDTLKDGVESLSEVRERYRKFKAKEVHNAQQSQ